MNNKHFHVSKLHYHLVFNKLLKYIIYTVLFITGAIPYRNTTMCLKGYMIPKISALKRANIC